jgi:hypothetical protein
LAVLIEALSRMLRPAPSDRAPPAEPVTVIAPLTVMSSLACSVTLEPVANSASIVCGEIVTVTPAVLPKVGTTAAPPPTKT